MPEIKNTFLKSKMNKDLDSRIIPNGEYRDAKNVSISRSEGANVGSLENVLGNIQLTDLKNKIREQEVNKIQKTYNINLRPNQINTDQIEIIGHHVETSRDLIFLFLTDYRDTSSDLLSNFASSDKILPVGNTFVMRYKGACCYIAQYNVLTNQSTILVSGSFLNFSKTHPINNVNLLEDLLFFTDNRNQPRKINIITALNKPWENSGANNPYYYNEDHISVAKYAPVNAFEFIDSNNESTLISNKEEFLPVHIITTLDQGQPPGGNNITFPESYVISGNNADYDTGDKVTVKAPFSSQAGTPNATIITEDKEYIITQPGNSNVVISGSVGVDIDAGAVIHIQRKNPKYDTAYKGDINLLQEKFSKFSYRFKYDDNEYSLISPFTQSAFIPRQFGYFTGTDEDKVSKSGNVAFMENMVDQVKLNLILPCNANELQDKLKVKELQILVKNSDEQSVRVIEDVDISKIASLGSTTRYEYNYLSSKPIKTLPEATLIRVHDKTPIKALTQEVIANRVIYGNFQTKHGSPSLLSYDLNSAVKSFAQGSSTNNITIEHPCHTLKQNRSYQVGIVLVDRYGRASNVILNDIDDALNKNSTIYIPYKSSNNLPSLNYFGNIISLSLREKIPSFSSNLNYPGLYSETNPLGYYSYRIVVKQQEQDYYNVYTPGAIAGDLTWNTIGFTKQNNSTPPQEDEAGNAEFLPSFNNVNDISLINLFGDNINKVPRELKTSSNANDVTFGSETILFNRVNPLSSHNVQSNINEQGEKVISIEPFRQLGDWTTTKGKLFPGENISNNSNNPVPTPWYPYHVTANNSNDAKFNFYDIFFKSQSNPFIAKIETDFKIGVTPTYTDKSTIESAWQDLGVFETKPTKSVIDIYYETSSSDLISNLNNNIDPNAYPAGVQDENGNNTVFGQNINYFHLESDNPLTTIVYLTNDFQLVDASGSVINTNSNLEIDSVTSSTPNGNTLNLTNQFDIVSGLSLSDSFRIILKSDNSALKYFSSISPIIDNYTFILKATDIQNPTPTYVNVPIQITNCQMQNVAPSITGTLDPEYEVRFTITNPHRGVRDKNDNPLLINGPLNSPGTNLIVKNGSADDFLSTQELSFELIDDVPGANPGNAADDFEFLGEKIKMKDGLFNGFFNNDGVFPDLPPNTEIIVRKGQVIFNYDVRLKVTDANGAGLTVESSAFRIKAIYSILNL